MSTHSFSGLGAAGIQVVSGAGQGEVAGFRTGPAAVLGPGGALLPAGGAAIRAAALGLGKGRAQDPAQEAGRDSQDRVLGRGAEKAQQRQQRRSSGLGEGLGGGDCLAKESPRKGLPSRAQGNRVPLPEPTPRPREAPHQQAVPRQQHEA